MAYTNPAFYTLNSSSYTFTVSCLKYLSHLLHLRRASTFNVWGSFHNVDIQHKFCLSNISLALKEGLYRIWCGVNRLGDSGVHILGDTSAFVNSAGQLLLTQWGKTRMDGVGIVFEFYIAPLNH